MISFRPDPDPNQFKPWWRRAVAWIGEFHKFATTLIAVAGVTVAVHVWLKGLITRAELDVAVQAATSKALVEMFSQMRADMETLKSNTGGLPAWRANVTERLGKVEDHASTNADQIVRVEARVDRFLTRAR